MDITFASLTTTAGAIAAAGVITLLIEIIKSAFPVIDAKVSGASMAFVLSALLYIAAAAAMTARTPDALLLVAVSWITCAASAVGIKSAVAHATTAGDGANDAVPPG